MRGVGGTLSKKSSTVTGIVILWARGPNVAMTVIVYGPAIVELSFSKVEFDAVVAPPSDRGRFTLVLESEAFRPGLLWSVRLTRPEKLPSVERVIVESPILVTLKDSDSLLVATLKSGEGTINGNSRMFGRKPSVTPVKFRVYTCGVTVSATVITTCAVVRFCGSVGLTVTLFTVIDTEGSVGVERLGGRTLAVRLTVPVKLLILVTFRYNGFSKFDPPWSTVTEPGPKVGWRSKYGWFVNFAVWSVSGSEFVDPFVIETQSRPTLVPLQPI